MANVNNVTRHCKQNGTQNKLCKHYEKWIPKRTINLLIVNLNNVRNDFLNAFVFLSETLHLTSLGRGCIVYSV